MNQISRRAQNRRDKTDRILRAAVQVFAQAGYGGATMDAIADAAGLSKPTLYQYFASKEVLFVAMMKVPGDAMLTAFEGDDTGDHVTQLHRFAMRYAQVVMQPAFLSIARLIIGEAQRFPQVGRAYQAAGPDLVQAALTRYMAATGEKGQLSVSDADLAAQDFWGLILSGPRNQALHHPDDLPSNAEVTRSVHNGLRVFLRAYAQDPQSDLAQLETVLAGDTL